MWWSFCCQRLSLTMVFLKIMPCDQGFAHRDCLRDRAAFRSEGMHWHVPARPFAQCRWWLQPKALSMFSLLLRWKISASQWCGCGNLKLYQTFQCQTMSNQPSSMNSSPCSDPTLASITFQMAQPPKLPQDAGFARRPGSQQPWCIPPKPTTPPPHGRCRCIPPSTYVASPRVASRPGASRGACPASCGWSGKKPGKVEAKHQKMHFNRQVSKF